MPSIKHEMPLELIRNCPAIAPELVVRAFKVDLPEYATATTGSETFTDLDVKTALADSTVVLRAAEDPAEPGKPGKPVLAIIVETQLAFNPEKLYKWPFYGSAARARLKCDVIVLVLCPDDAVAARYAQPIRLGPGFMMLPLVIGPRDMPVVTDEDTARRLPELVCLTAPAHADSPQREEVLNAVLTATDTVKKQHAELARL